jgi:hypothetical protein
MTSQRLARASLAALALSASGLSACSSPARKPLSHQDMALADPLPLSKGTRWAYQVTVKRYDPEQDKETTKTLSWATEVLDAREAGGVTAYRVKGWLTDLADLEHETPVATERTILRHGNDFLFGASAEPTLDGAEGWFSWPVIDGQKICPSAEIAYCWQVTALETGYRLSFYTGPDEQQYEIEPGTGVARYRYAHHGTTNEVEAKLVSFNRAGKR